MLCLLIWILAAQTLTYLSSMTLEMELVRNGDGRIYTPLLKVSYKHQDEGEVDSTTTVLVSYHDPSCQHFKPHVTPLLADNVNPNKHSHKIISTGFYNLND